MFKKLFLICLICILSIGASLADDCKDKYGKHGKYIEAVKKCEFEYAGKLVHVARSYSSDNKCIGVEADLLIKSKRFTDEAVLHFKTIRITNFVVIKSLEEAFRSSVDANREVTIKGIHSNNSDVIILTAFYDYGYHSFGMPAVSEADLE